MIYVILRDKRVLQYNQVTAMSTANGFVRLWTGKNNADHVAEIPSDMIERVEWSKPCKILKEYKRKSYRRY